MSTDSGPPSKGRNTALLGIAALVLMSVVGVSYFDWRGYSRANDAAAQTRAIVDSADRLLISLIDAETGQRGFLLTGENRYLEPYNRAIQQVPGELSTASRLLASRPGQSASAARLNALTADELAELRENINLRRTSGVAPSLAVVLIDRGKQTMDQIRAICDHIRRAEISSQSQASTEGEAAAGTALLATIAGALLLLFLFTFGLEPFASPEPQAWQRSWPLRYGAAVLAVVAMALLRAALTPFIGRTTLPFELFFCAVACAAWFGGFRPAILSIALSLMAGDYLFAVPQGSLWVTERSDQVAMLMLIVVGFGIALLSRAQRSAVDRALRAEAAERNERQRFATTLSSIGDAVIATDTNGLVTFANRVALSLTQWTEADATGKPLDEVFRIINEFTRATVESPVAKVLREGSIVGLANHTLLIAKDGTEIPIDDSAAPIQGSDGIIQGTVLVFRDITERLKAEERTHLAVEAAPNAMIMVGRDGHIELINSETEKLFGYKRDELLGQTVDILLPERYRAGHEGFRASFFREPRARPMGAGRDLFGVCKDGREVPIEIALSPINTSQGDFVLAAIIDISERREAEKAFSAAFDRAQKAELLLNGIMDYVPEGITYAEAPDVTIRMVSRYGRELISKPRELIEGIAVEEHAEKWDIHNLDGTLARNEELPLTRAVKNGDVVLDEEWIVRDSAGREILLLCNAGPIRDIKGNILGGIIAWRDITERKEAEVALRHSEERLATVMKHLPVGVGLIDTNGHIEIANAEWKRLLHGNLPSVDSVESSRWKAVAPDGRPLPFHEYPGQRALRGEELLPGVDFLREDDGGPERWTRVGAVPLRDETGQITGALVMLQDVDEERRAEAQRAELLAKERALETEKALRETEAELARVMRALSLGELASSIAHEVNQPLAGVVTNAEAGLRWLGTNPPSIGEAKESLAMIAEDGERAGEVIRRLREFLKKRSPETAPLQINEVVQEAVALTRAELERRQIGIRMDLSGDLPPTRGDRIQLQQVIVNLIMNGVEAMAATGASKELVATSRRSADGRILVGIRDSGVGISAENMPRMFDAFFTTKSTGMGMGLSISRSIVEAHRGRIWAEANEGPGLTVQFTLPVQEAGKRSSAVGELS